MEALIHELRQQAEELRAHLGPTRLPPPVARGELLEQLGETALASETAPTGLGELASGHLATMRALYDPRAADLHSHRGQLGRVVIAAKRVLRRLLTPFFDRQTGFNRAAIESFASIEVALRSQDKVLRKIERQLAMLEHNLAELPGAARAATGALDYVDFESAFRGDGKHVKHALEHYLGFFPGSESGPVLDLGCGRGEFLELLRERGIAATGIDRDPEMVARCRERGLDVRAGDLLAELGALRDGSLGGVVSFQVIEHLPLAKLIELIALARTKLRPGGCLIAETINPQSLVTFARAWSIDPTHGHPVHPLTLRFLVEHAGFARSEIVYSGEVPAEERLEHDGSSGAAARNLARLNALLFAPQDYAVVAWT